MYIGGSWGAYYYNGHVYSSEIYRGLDVFDLTPTEFLTQNELDAARLVHYDQLNPQTQPKIVWPAAFPVARAYLDQLARDKGLAPARTSAAARDLDAAEKLTGARRASGAAAARSATGWRRGRSLGRPAGPGAGGRGEGPGRRGALTVRSRTR